MSGHSAVGGLQERLPAGWTKASAGTSGGPGVVRGRERGMVTAELAMASMLVAVVIVVMSWLAVVVALAVRCQDTAWEVARQEARGDAAASRQARTAAPEGARVAVGRRAGQVRVVVALDARPWVSWMPSVPLRLVAVTLAEPGSP